MTKEKQEGAAHTPGPWEWGGGVGDNGGRFTSLEAPGHHDVIDGEHGCHVRNPANARLIAAAPDLLAALEECANTLSYQPEEGEHVLGNAPLLKRVNAAIARATGKEVDR